MAGWILYWIGYAEVLVDLYRHFRERRRQEVEWVLKWILGGVYGGWPVVAAWAFVSNGSDAAWMAAILFLSLFGFLQWNIAAYMAKIMPFLRWMGRYGHRAVKSPSGRLDRKSTRLNSSHVKISYAVFCLKKKKE